MEQLTKKQERALDKMIKVISRKFPFITGWKPSDDFLTYNTLLNIDFMVDYNKLCKFFGVEPEEYWLNYIDREGSFETYTLGGPFSYDKYPHIKDLPYDTTKKIESVLNNMNEELPEGFQITYPFTNFRGEDVLVPRQIRRDNYIIQ